MKQTNFDKFLAEQMTEHGFAAAFRKAARSGIENFASHRRPPPAGRLPGNHKPGPAREISGSPWGAIIMPNANKQLW